MTPAIIPFEEGQKWLDWRALVAALTQKHQGPKAEIEDLFLYLSLIHISEPTRPY